MPEMAMRQRGVDGETVLPIRLRITYMADEHLRRMTREHNAVA